MAESSSVKKENLRKTLDLLQRKLVQTHAEVRRVRRTVETKTAMLKDSDYILRHELKDAFFIDAAPARRKRRRLLPPPGLMPLLTAQPEEDHDNGSSEESQDDYVCLQSCTGWIRGSLEDHVWLRIEVQNASSTVRIRDAHAFLSTDVDPTLLPSTIRHSTRYSIGPNKTAVLYAAFRLPVDIMPQQIFNKLRVSCRYSVDDEWRVSETKTVSWTLDKRDLGWKDSDSAPFTFLPVYFPSYVQIDTDCSDWDQIKVLLNLEGTLSDNSVSLFHSSDGDLVLSLNKHQTDRACVWGLVDRKIAQCVHKLKDNGMLQNIKIAPRLLSSQCLRNLVVSLQDEIGYVKLIHDTNLDNEPRGTEKEGAIAARAKTLLHLSKILENPPKLLE